MSADGPRGTAARRAPDVAAVVVLLVLAAAPAWPVYQHPAVVVLVLGATAVGTGIAVLGARLRWPTHTLVAATVAAYLLVGVPLALPEQAVGRWAPSIAGLRDLVLGTVSGWRDVLTTRPPFGTDGVLAVPLLVVVLVATVTGTSIALRARRPGWAVLAPLVVLVHTVVFGSAAAPWAAACGAALFVVAALWAALRAEPGARPLVLLRRTGAATLVVALCGGAALALVADRGAAADRHVLRDLVTPPLDVRELSNPLVEYRNHVTLPGAEVELWRVDGLPEGARVRLVALDAYDGTVFAVGDDPSSGTFEHVPYRLDRTDVVGTRARVTLTALADDADWLPTVGELVSVTRAGGASGDGSGNGAADDLDPADDTRARVYYDVASSIAAVPDGVRRGESFVLDTVVAAAVEEDELAAAAPGDARQKETPHIPDELLDVVDHHATGSTPGERLVALAAWLRTGYVSHSGEDEPYSRPGHSSERLRRLLTEDPVLGDAEQYATALALGARQLGFPSRVVVGYAPQPGQEVLTGADTTAWVEVQLADGRWAAVDPNPEPRPVPTTQDRAPELVSRPETVLPPPPAPIDDSTADRSDDEPEENPDEEEPGWIGVLRTVARVGALTLATLTLVTSPFWLLALAGIVRRAARRRDDRRRGVVTGAWQEVLDAMVDRGHDVHPAATRSEAAALSGSGPVREMAERADRAVFSRHPVSADDVEDCWARVPAARRSLDAGRSRRDRLRRVLAFGDARSLRRARRVRRGWIGP